MSALLSVPAWGSVNVDIHVDGFIQTPDSPVSFFVTVSPCSQATTAAISAGAFQRTVPISQFSPRPGADACDYLVPLERLGSGAITVTIRRDDTVVAQTTEQFPADRVPPTVQVQSVSIVGQGAGQALRVVAQAADQQDLAQVRLNVLGIRASTLRSTGGVVELARRSAFAATAEPVVLRPIKDDQREFSVDIPLSQALSAEQIALDGVVLVDVEAMDAYGNRAVDSAVRFTGDSVRAKFRADAGKYLRNSDGFLTGQFWQLEGWSLLRDKLRGSVVLESSIPPGAAIKDIERYIDLHIPGGLRLEFKNYANYFNASSVASVCGGWQRDLGQIVRERGAASANEIIDGIRKIRVAFRGPAGPGALEMVKRMKLDGENALIEALQKGGANNKVKGEVLAEYRKRMDDVIAAIEGSSGGAVGKLDDVLNEAGLAVIFQGKSSQYEP